MSTFLLVLACLAIVYVLGPIQYLAGHSQAAPGTAPVPLDEAPARVGRALSRWRTAFGEDGPELVGVQGIVPPGADPAASAPVAHVLHFIDRDAAVHALDYVTPHGRWQVFLTRYDDGAEVVTTNYPRALTLAPHPQAHVARMPRVSRLADLRTLHGVHVAQVMGARTPAPIADEGIDGFVADHELRTLERQREVGAMKLAGGVYRPTFRGAFMSFWSYLPPLRWINGAREARVARQLMDALK